MFRQFSLRRAPPAFGVAPISADMITSKVHLESNNAEPSLKEAPGSAYSSSSSSSPHRRGVVTTQPPPSCLLCDQEFIDWGEHQSSKAHRARHAVCASLVNADKQAQLLQQMWDHIQVDFEKVGTLNMEKVRRRRQRLSSSLNFLRDTGIISHAVWQVPPEVSKKVTTTTTPAVNPAAQTGSEASSTAADAESMQEGASAEGDANSATTAVETSPTSEECAVEVPAAIEDVVPAPKKKSSANKWHISRQFTKLILQGESELRSQGTDRIARLLPKISGSDLSAAAQTVFHLDNMELAYDYLNLSGLMLRDDIKKRSIGKSGIAADVPLSREEKGAIFLAVFGELVNFVNKERPQNVTTKVVADTLVLNVLASHSVENIVSEIVHEALQRMVDEGNPVWKQYRSELQTYSAKSLRRDGKTMWGPEPPSKFTRARPTAAPRLVTEYGGEGELADESPNSSPEHQEEQVRWAEVYDLAALQNTGAAGSGATARNSPTVRSTSSMPKPQLITRTHEVAQACTLTITVKKPVNKASFFAPVLPRIAPARPEPTNEQQRHTRANAEEVDAERNVAVDRLGPDATLTQRKRQLTAKPLYTKGQVGSGFVGRFLYE